MSYVPELPRCPNGGKVCFSKKDAQAKVNFLTKKNNPWEKRRSKHVLRIYQCPACNWWHITHERRHTERS